jgi:DNA-binding NarL/FixJ family response regulator
LSGEEHRNLIVRPVSRILIVEDEALVAMELGLLIEDMGHEVAGFATDSRMALDEARVVDIDLALIDVHLADGPTGPEVGRKLADQGVSVLFITGNPTMINDAGHCAVGVLAKPANENLIEDAIRYALSRREGLDMSPPAQLMLLS